MKSWRDFADRIVYRRIEKFPAGHGAWWNENYQRNEISKVLSEIGVRDEDEYLRQVRWARFGRTLQGRCVQFAETVCPPALHNWLHLVKMRLLRDRRA